MAFINKNHTGKTCKVKLLVLGKSRSISSPYCRSINSNCSNDCTGKVVVVLIVIVVLEIVPSVLEMSSSLIKRNDIKEKIHSVLLLLLLILLLLLLLLLLAGIVIVISSNNSNRNDRSSNI